MKLFLHDGDRSPLVYPLIEKASWIPVGQVGKTDASVGCWIFGNTTESVDEDVTGDLHAEGHVGIVVSAGIVLTRLIGACLKFPARC